MSSKNKQPITLVEIISNADYTFEIKLRHVEDKAIPVLVGLLEKAKFELLARDFEEELDQAETPQLFTKSKFEA